MTLNDLLDADIGDCPCGRRHRVATAEVIIAPGALQTLADVAARHLSGGPIALLVDANTWAAAGSAARRLLRSAGRQVSPIFVDAHANPAHADDATLSAASAAVTDAGATAIVAVGSGTISDLGKSCAAAADLPLATVPTAASMNGFTSAISAIMKDGVKITVPSRPPAAVVVDPAVLATAPSRMTGAGYGDLLSKTASTADWRLGRILFDDYYCELPSRIVDDAIKDCIEHAEDIRSNSPHGLHLLAEALIRSGISMVMAGSSAPASGGEHLISHLWDMNAHWTGRTPALHGEQTGVAALISLALYEKLSTLTAADIERLPAEVPFASIDDMEKTLTTRFRDLAPSVMPYAQGKFLPPGEHPARRRRIMALWPQIRSLATEMVVSPPRFAGWLSAAGAATGISQLGIGAEELQFAVLNARWIRDRYTVLDLAADIGVLEAWVAPVIRRAGVLDK